jgi:hypothetical protein
VHARKHSALATALILAIVAKNPSSRTETAVRGVATTGAATTMVGYQNASLYKIDHPCGVSLRQAHLQHQTTDAMAPDAPTVATQMPRHLSRGSKASTNMQASAHAASRPQVDRVGLERLQGHGGLFECSS